MNKNKSSPINEMILVRYLILLYRVLNLPNEGDTCEIAARFDNMNNMSQYRKVFMQTILNKK